MNYDGILKDVEQKIKDATAVGDPERLLSWLKVLEKMKDCGLLQVNKGSNNVLKQINENLN